MKAGEPLVIQRVANGYIVAPLNDNLHPSQALTDFHVFQEIGRKYSYTSGTLIDFICNHFTEEEPKE